MAKKTATEESPKKEGKKLNKKIDAIKKIMRDYKVQRKIHWKTYKRNMEEAMGSMEASAEVVENNVDTHSK